MRSSLILLGVGALLAAALACGAPRAVVPDFAAGERPNVLIVLTDVLRRDHLGVYGYPLPTSPAIDAFAGESFRFDQAFSHSSWTKPSVATLFSSVYPDRHGLGRVGFEDGTSYRTDILPLELETLAERFKAAGYRTGSFGSNVHLQRKTGFGQGFDQFFMKRLVTAYGLNRRFLDWRSRGSSAPGPARQPFFAYLHYMDAHWPYNRRLDDGGERFGSTRYPRQAPPERWTAVGRWAESYLDAESLAVIVARYDEEIAYLDRAFGELIDALRQDGGLEQTIVLFVADHGEGFSEHGELQHGFAPYPEVTAVPMLLRLPEVYRAQPGASDALVGLVDVMPTLLALVGLEPPSYVRGRSLVPLLLTGGAAVRPVYVSGEGMRALRGPAYTLFVSVAGERRCFDRSVDPLELTPLAGELPAGCERLASGLDALVSTFSGVVGAEDGDGTVELNADEVEALKDLGYIE